MVPRGEHAIVLGAGVAGLLAARALADYYIRVTVVERDPLPHEAAARRGVPQGRHAHWLASRGREIIEEFFPGFRAELQGAISFDLGRDVRWHLGGGYFAQSSTSTGDFGLLVSQPVLEAQLRALVSALPNVYLIDCSDVMGLETSEDEARVTGVRLRRRALDCDEVMKAGFVVDASGRGSVLPYWLNGIGYPAPEEERIEVHIGFASQMYRRTTPLPDGAYAVIGHPEPGLHRSGAYVAIDEDRWLVTLAGSQGDYPPIDPSGFRAFARDVVPVEVPELVEYDEPLGTFSSYRLAATVRRHYERLHRFPQGLLVVGDALCTLNPLYGQGMTMAALEAVALRACLEEGTYGLAQRFFEATAREIDAAWKIGSVEGWYQRRLLFAARFDEVVALRFLEVMTLTRPRRALMSVGTLWRVLLAHVAQAHVGPSEDALECGYGAWLQN